MRIPMKNDSYICIQTTILLEQRTVADPGFGPGVGGGGAERHQISVSRIVPANL